MSRPTPRSRNSSRRSSSSRSTPSPRRIPRSRSHHLSPRIKPASARRGRSHGSRARRGSRPRAVRQTGFTSLYALAAVCRRHKGGVPKSGPRKSRQPFVEVLAGRPSGCIADLDGGLQHRLPLWWSSSNVSLIQPRRTGRSSIRWRIGLLACVPVQPPVPGFRRVAGGGGQESMCGPRRHRNDQDRLRSPYISRGVWNCRKAYYSS